MRVWNFYDLGTGIFNGVVFVGPENQLSGNLPNGCGAMYGVVDALSQQVDIAATALIAAVAVSFVDPISGATCTMPTAPPTPILIDYQPSTPVGDAMQSWTWDALTKRWQSVPTFAAMQARKWLSIKAARDAALNAPLLTAHGTFDCDLASRANIAGAVALAQTLAASTPPFTITYTLADNSVVTLDGPEMVGVGLALGAKVQVAFATGRELRLQIQAATSADALNLINWPNA